MDIGDNLFCLLVVVCIAAVAITFIIQVGKNNRPPGGDQ